MKSDMCEYCEGRRYLLNQNVTDKLSLIVSTHEKTLGVRLSNAELDVYIDLKTNFCPVCGKNLKEQTNELTKDLEVTSDTKLNDKIKQDKLHGY